MVLIYINKSIRPIVNWKGSPGYKLAIYLTKLLKHTMHLTNVYNVQNSATLMHNLEQITIHPNIRTCSFDITNMYTNIPIKELINIIQESLTHNHIPNEYKNEIMALTKIVLNQNYFQYNDELYTHKDGLAMGAPTSSIF
jgi:hypothetical protein